ncbi:UNVERIFIED_CONTAM: hypothetical protein K2H54_040471 [Gekko kuhli]
MLSGEDEGSVPTTTESEPIASVTEIPITIQSRVLASPYPNLPFISPGQVTQWGQFHQDSTKETYVLTKGPQRDSRWDLQGKILYHTIPGGAVGETNSVWNEPRRRDAIGTAEEQVEVPDDEDEDEEEDWGPHLAALATLP